MIKFRYHLKTYSGSLLTYTEFDTIDNMLKSIETTSNGKYKAQNISISESIGEDRGIHWNSVRYVYASSCGSDPPFDSPKCFGFCDLGERN